MATRFVFGPVRNAGVVAVAVYIGMLGIDFQVTEPLTW
jgi:hypothetical protein